MIRNKKLSYPIRRTVYQKAYMLARSVMELGELLSVASKRYGM